MKNKAATKKRNRMWNLAWVSGSFFYRGVKRNIYQASQERSTLGEESVWVFTPSLWLQSDRNRWSLNAPLDTAVWGGSSDRQSHTPQSVTAHHVPPHSLTALYSSAPTRSVFLNQYCRSWLHRYSLPSALETGTNTFDPLKGKKQMSCTHGPEFDEILGDCCTNDQAVEWSVGQEQDEELVVWEADAVVHPEWRHVKQHETQGETCFPLMFKDILHIPGAVMVHFQYTPGRRRSIYPRSMRSR